MFVNLYVNYVYSIKRFMFFQRFTLQPKAVVSIHLIK